MVQFPMRFNKYFGGFLTLIIFFGGVLATHASTSPIKEYPHNFVADAVNTGNYKYEGGSWLVEGIGEDYIPDNLNLDIIDEGIYASDKDAFARVDELLRKEGILAGTSCGTLVDAAIKWCQKQTEPKKVVTLICDTGNKYLSKAFNKDWLKENELID